MHSLISEQLNSRLDEVVTKCFEGNRIMDRGVNVLGIKYAMNKTEKVLHSKLAHLFPQLADEVSSYQSSRNNLTFYGVTPADGSDYSTPLNFFEKMLDFMVDLEALISEVLELADSEEDKVTSVFLQNFLMRITLVTSQCLLLVDKGENYKDWMLFDHNIDDFIVL